MKLLIASLTTAIVLSSAASVVVAQTKVASVGSKSNATVGIVTQVPVDSLNFDGRTKAKIGSDTVTITTFKNPVKR